MTQFDRDIALEAISSNEYQVQIADTWNIHVGPNGGYIAAILLKGMKQKVEPKRSRSFTCHFISASVAGPASLKIEIIKSGRTLSTINACLSQNGKTIAFAIGTFANDTTNPYLRAVNFSDNRMPLVKPAHEISVADRMKPGADNFVPFRAKYDQRPAIGPKPGTANMDGVAKVGGWTRFTETRAYDDLALLAISDSWYPAIFSKSEAKIHTPTVDHTVHFLAPSTSLESEDFVLVQFQTDIAENGFLVEDGCIWSSAGELLVKSRQLAIILPQ